jgi:membrane protease YdiL (CAAX protease family)
MPEALEKEASAEMAIGRSALRWWDPLLVLVFALVAWLIVVGGTALLLGGSPRSWGDPRLAAPSAYAANPKHFYALHFYAATLYVAALITMYFLARWRGFHLFTDYFTSIPFRSTLRAALVGSGISGAFLLLVLGNRVAPVPTLPMLHHKLGWFVASAASLVIIAPVVEELYFRGILLDCLKQRFSPILSARISAAAFALVHFRFLFHPGIGGWMETIFIYFMGLLFARWALRTNSLLAPVAGHVCSNTLAVLLIFFLG